MADTAAGFDASKQGKAPDAFLAKHPKDSPAVRIGFVNSTVGYGLFAARKIVKEEYIFHEEPILKALFNEKFSSDKRIVDSQYQVYKDMAAAADRPNDKRHNNHFSTSDMKALQTAFPNFAAKTGVFPPHFAATHPILDNDLGMYLVHGRFDGSTITREEYEAYSAAVVVPRVNFVPTEADIREACLDFFKHYAFEDMRKTVVARVAGVDAAIPSSSNASSNACIYLLGSLINHCCTHKYTEEKGPNCTWRIGSTGLVRFIRDKHIAVQATRDIREGEQLTWDYGKREKGFVCECETCKTSGVIIGIGCGIV
ncbi:hypothetical protein B0H66DRAFT_62097 [Apodospora peruviana]|uniref:SET domain-containing protein n=1 Tax=Apodospora peruviana TaxID=516989 RepID=A0AAE0ISF1_9PEZI|nr:hypothetical protein B0H66DRAFT_62097 [Apodospora peruviana]